MTENAKKYCEKMFSGCESDLLRTDPEFVDFFGSFAFDDVVNVDDLDGKTRLMAILATLLGCQGIDEFKLMLIAAYNFGVTPVEMKEIVYQGVAYLGIGRVMPFLNAVNSFIENDLGMTLPLKDQATVTRETRLELGEKAQMACFGEHMKGYAYNGPEDFKHLNRWLTSNCFGDYYTRGGLTIPQREMCTFCYIAAQGGCEPQLIAHAKANMYVGNDKEFLIKIINNNIPYIGYPRTLNAYKCVQEACK